MSLSPSLSFLPYSLLPCGDECRPSLALRQVSLRDRPLNPVLTRIRRFNFKTSPLPPAPPSSQHVQFDGASGLPAQVSHTLPSLFRFFCFLLTEPCRLGRSPPACNASRPLLAPALALAPSRCPPWRPSTLTLSSR